MMGKFLTFLFLILTGLILSFFFYLKFGAGDISDFVVAKTIPRYPNSSSWSVTASSGFPDGSPGGDIYFETADNAQSVANFYEDILPKQGWSTTQTGSYYAIFNKNVGTTTFTVNVEKNESIYSQSKRVTIWVGHGR